MIVTVAVVSCILTAALIGVEAYGIYQSHQDAEDSVGAVDLLSESLENLISDIVDVLQSFVDALQDFAVAIMQYMDIWGIVIISCVAVVGVISFMNLILVSRRPRR